MGFSTIGGAGGGSEETPSGGAGSSGHEGVDDQSSSNDDQITIKDGEIIINDDSDDVDFRVETDGNASMLFIDAGTDRVGIGESSLDAILHMTKAAAGLCNIKMESAGSAGWRFGIPASNTSLVFDNANDALTAPKMTLDANGNLGLGTSSPDSLLEVAKAAADAEVLISAYHDTEATTPKLTFRKADNTEASPALVDDNAVLGTISFQGHDGSGFEQGAKIEARIQGDPSDGSDMPTELTFWTTPNGSATSTERFSIDGSGRVGIGTVSAAQTAAGLEIFKDLGAPDDLSEFDDYQLVLKGGYDTGDYAAMLLTSSTDGYGGSAIAHIDTGGAGQGDLVFYTQQGTAGAAPVEGMRLGSDGAVALKAQSAPSATADYAKLYATGAGTSTDPNVKLLLLGEGSDGASTITDSSTGGKSPSSATAETDTAQYKFGSSSILFERSNSDKITYADHADWDLDGEFSIDFWVRFQNANTGGDSGYGHSCIVRGAGGWRIQWTGLYYTNADASTDGWEFAYGGSMTRIMFADAISDTNWHHVAITRDSSDVIRCYRDGAKKGSNATQASTYACTDLVFGVNGSSDYHDGWVDEFRLISGDDNGWNDDSSITVPAASMGGGYAELYALDASGNATKISPHNSKNEWEFYSKNQTTGKTVRINMEEVVRDLGQLTGKNYIKDE